MRMSAQAHAPYLQLIRTQHVLSLECRASGLERVLFVHGARTHVLGSANRSMVAELHRLEDRYAVVCHDRPAEHRRHGTVRVRAWVSRDEGETWQYEASFDISTVNVYTRVAREESAA